MLAGQLGLEKYGSTPSKSDETTAVGHWRTHDNKEVDLIIERDNGDILAFEIKASQRCDASDMSSLRLLRDTLGNSFRGGYVFYFGRRSYNFDDRLFVVPVDRLWVDSQAPV